MLTQKMETHQIEIDSSRTRKDINIGAVQSNAQYMMTESPHFLSLLHCIWFIYFFYFDLRLFNLQWENSHIIYETEQ